MKSIEIEIVFYKDWELIEDFLYEFISSNWSVKKLRVEDVDTDKISSIELNRSMLTDLHNISPRKKYWYRVESKKHEYEFYFWFRKEKHGRFLITLKFRIQIIYYEN